MTLTEQVSPLDIHRESLLDVEEQLRFLIHMMKGAQISCFLPLLKGSFSCWIWTNLGILVEPTFFFVLHMNIIYLVEKAENKKRMTIVTFQKEKKTELCYNL